MPRDTLQLTGAALQCASYYSSPDVWRLHAATHVHCQPEYHAGDAVEKV